MQDFYCNRVFLHSGTSIFTQVQDLSSSTFTQVQDLSTSTFTQVQGLSTSTCTQVQDLSSSTLTPVQDVSPSPLTSILTLSPWRWLVSRTGPGCLWFRPGCRRNSWTCCCCRGWNSASSWSSPPHQALTLPPGRCGRWCTGCCWARAGRWWSEIGRGCSWGSSPWRPPPQQALCSSHCKHWIRWVCASLHLVFMSLYCGGVMSCYFCVGPWRNHLPGPMGYLHVILDYFMIKESL